MRLIACGRYPVAQAGEYTTQEVAKLTGATYRQCDYWLRSGIVGFPSGIGSGSVRFFTSPEVVFFRSLVVSANAIRGRHRKGGENTALVRMDDRFEGVIKQLENAYATDPSLAGLVLVVDEHTATVTEREFYLSTGMAEAAIIVDLAACARCLPEEEA